LKTKKNEKDNVFDYQKISNINMTIDERKKLNIGNIWSNEAKCKKCGDIIRSKNLHHFVGCSCGSIFVDGGSWYAKRSGNPEDIEDLTKLFNEIQDK